MFRKGSSQWLGMAGIPPNNGQFINIFQWRIEVLNLLKI